MKGIILFVLFFISTAFSYDYIKQVNSSNFNLNGVTCRAENTTFYDPYREFITIDCDDNSEFSANVYYLTKNSCIVKKIVGSDTIKYSSYYNDSNSNVYASEAIKDEYGVFVSVKKVYIDCVSIYKKFKSKVVGRIRKVKYK